MSGVSVETYWSVALAWDVAVILLLVALLVGVLEAFGVPSYTERDNLPAVVSLVLAYLLASAAAVHLAEKLFSEPSLAQVTRLKKHQISND